MSKGIPTTWPALFCNTKRRLRMMHERCDWIAGFAGDDGRDIAHYFARLDMAIACIGVFEGADVAASAAKAVHPVFEAIVRDLAPNWYVKTPLELVGLIAYQHIADGCDGSPEPRIDTQSALKTLAKTHNDTAAFEVRLTLTALAAQHDHLAGFLPPRRGDFEPGATFGPNVGGFVHFLRLAIAAGADPADIEPGWQSFVLLFPRMLAAKSASWEDLVLAASIVHHRFGGHPLEQTIARLHDELQAIKV